MTAIRHPLRQAAGRWCAARGPVMAVLIAALYSLLSLPWHRPLGRRAGARLLALIMIAFIGLAACESSRAQPNAARGIPAQARDYQRELTRVVQQEWGMAGQVTIHAAQIHQESAWRPGVASHAGAQGLSQFMPGTSRWIAELYPDLGPAAPYSPGWAMRAQARYNKWHWKRLSATANACERWAMAMSAYNGGLGWVKRDRRLATAAGDDPARWFGHVERYTNRAGWAKRENRGYVRRILLELTPRYARAGWQGGAPC